MFKGPCACCAYPESPPLENNSTNCSTYAMRTSVLSNRNHPSFITLLGPEGAGTYIVAYCCIVFLLSLLLNYNNLEITSLICTIPDSTVFAAFWGNVCLATCSIVELCSFFIVCLSPPICNILKPTCLTRYLQHFGLKNVLFPPYLQCLELNSHMTHMSHKSHRSFKPQKLTTEDTKPPKRRSHKSQESDKPQKSQKSKSHKSPESKRAKKPPSKLEKPRKSHWKAAKKQSKSCWKAIEKPKAKKL